MNGPGTWVQELSDVGLAERCMAWTCSHVGPCHDMLRSIKVDSCLGQDDPSSKYQAVGCYQCRLHCTSRPLAASFWQPAAQHSLPSLSKLERMPFWVHASLCCHAGWQASCGMVTCRHTTVENTAHSQYLRQVCPRSGGGMTGSTARHAPSSHYNRSAGR